MMKLSSSLRKWIPVGALAMLLAVPTIAQAQVGINPMLIDAESRKGQARGMFSVTNASDEVIRVRVSAYPFTYTVNGFQVLSTSPTDLTPYLAFSPRELVIQPRQTRQVRLSAQLLPSLKDREFRAVIFTENLKATTDKNGVAIVPRIGVTLYVRQGVTAPKLSADSVSYNAQAKNFALLVKNTGNATARPKVNWKLSNAAGTLLSGTSESTTVIAEGERKVILDLPKAIAPGTYQLSGELIWERSASRKAQSFNLPLTVNAATTQSPNATR
ncbi:P pilus assembly protein, chaperone PapD [Leptolyngbya sp. FACHB-36]|uniref:P pilus assembly protein, chaperone PapD n=1 Tax=Leptolyngbya sp. FACHB-36 TaxID=2692808 RepID=UPI00168067F8|nr:P pilus assembly protein, chaperone PapD [Leptolyngbya sp. FACHB-36]MBD2020846.1 P pilus assembly protein, chaperone PapD [Leptolyngbya sp. FACHB-36]